MRCHERIYCSLKRNKDTTDSIVYLSNLKPFLLSASLWLCRFYHFKIWRCIGTMAPHKASGSLSGCRWILMRDWEGEWLERVLERPRPQIHTLVRVHPASSPHLTNTADQRGGGSGPSRTGLGRQHEAYALFSAASQGERNPKCLRKH